MDTLSKHFTHVIKCVVGSNKVVSAQEAHVEIPKVERFRMREGRKGERLASACQRPKNGPIMPRTPKHVPHLLQLSPRLAQSSSSPSSFIGALLSSMGPLTVFDGSARLP